MWSMHLNLRSGIALNETLMPGAERVRRSRMYEQHAFEVRLKIS